MIIAVLIVLGLALGSFVNALVWRLHAKKDWVKGRSECVRCGHSLAPIDLVPVLSWLSLHGKCRYCRKPISWQYPLVELATAGLFVASYLFWPASLTASAELLRFGLWLIVLTGLMAAAIYDLRWMILPDKITYTLLYLTLGWALISAVFFDGGTALIRDSIIGVLIGGGLFYVLYQVSNERWIGGGDVKLGFLMGLVLGARDALIALYIASLSGLIIMGGLLVTHRVTRKSKVPFGPFLIVATILARLFGQSLAHWYKAKFL